jgi:hypothetical protein
LSAAGKTGPSVEQKLRATWRRECRLRHLRGLSLLIIWGVVLLLLNLLVDWLFMIPGFGRVLLLLINLGTLGAVFYFRWYRRLRGFDPVRVALQVEKQHPEFKSLLVSYVQLDDASLGSRAASPALLRAMRRQTLTVTGPVDFRTILSLGELRRILLFSAGTLLLFAVLSVQWADFFKILAMRLLNPTFDAGYPTSTVIERISGNLTVKQDDPVTIETVGGGQLPREGSLYTRVPRGGWEKVILRRGEGNSYSHRFGQVFKSFDYRVRLGDAASKTYSVRAVPPPRLVAARLKLKHPAYTGLPEAEVGDLNASVPEGSLVEGHLEVNTPLAGAEMVPKEGPAVPLKIGGDGRLLGFSVKATRALSFFFRWREREHGFVYDDPVRHTIGVKPDSAPRVDLLEPARDIKATVEKSLALSYRPTDDYGLTAAAIVYSLNDADEKRRALPGPGGGKAPRSAVWRLREDIPGLKPGDVVNFAVEVADNRPKPAGPNVTRSRDRRIEILTREEYLKYVLDQKSVLVGKIERIKAEEKKASDQVKQLERKSQPVGR